MKMWKLKLIILIGLLTGFNVMAFSQTKEDLNIIEKPAEFPGGRDEMFKFIKKNLQYPKETCVEGLVFVQFSVEPDGSLSNIKVVRGLSQECDAEAVRVFSIMPKWIPAIEPVKKKPTKNYFTIPCRFRVE